MHLDVRFSCDLANVPPVAADAFKASGIGCSPGGLTDHGARGGLRPALVAPGARPGRSRPARPPLPAPPAARAVSDAATGIASVLIVAEVERAEASRLVGAHRASVKDKDPLAPVVVAGQLAQAVVVASGREAGEFFATYGWVKRRR